MFRSFLVFAATLWISATPVRSLCAYSCSLHPSTPRLSVALCGENTTLCEAFYASNPAPTCVVCHPFNFTQASFFNGVLRDVDATWRSTNVTVLLSGRINIQFLEFRKQKFSYLALPNLRSAPAPVALESVDNLGWIDLPIQEVALAIAGRILQNNNAIISSKIVLIVADVNDRRSFSTRIAIQTLFRMFKAENQTRGMFVMSKGHAKDYLSQKLSGAHAVEILVLAGQSSSEAFEDIRMTLTNPPCYVSLFSGQMSSCFGASAPAVDFNSQQVAATALSQGSSPSPRSNLVDLNAIFVNLNVVCDVVCRSSVRMRLSASEFAALAATRYPFHGRSLDATQPISHAETESAQLESGISLTTELFVLTFPLLRRDVVQMSSISGLVFDEVPLEPIAPLRAQELPVTQAACCAFGSSSFLCHGGLIEDGTVTDQMFRISRNSTSGSFTVTTIRVTSATRPLGRSSHAIACNESGHIFLYGGSQSGALSGDLWLGEISFRSGNIEWRESIPYAPRSGHTLTIHSDDNADWLYVSGGSSAVELSSVARFSLQLQYWVELAMPVHPLPDCVFATDHRLVILGKSRTSPELGISAAVFDYHERWSDVIPMRLNEAFDYQCIQGPSDSAAGSGLFYLLPKVTRAEVAAGVAMSTVPLRYVLNQLQECPRDHVLDVLGEQCVACSTGTYATSGAKQCTPCGDDISLQSPFWIKYKCSSAPAGLGIVAIIFVLFVQLLVVPVLWFADYQIRQKRDNVLNDEVALEISDAVAKMKFDRVSYLERENSFSRVGLALSSCVRNFRLYRNFVPGTVLTLADAAVQEFEAELEKRELASRKKDGIANDDAASEFSLEMSNAGSARAASVASSARFRRRQYGEGVFLSEKLVHQLKTGCAPSSATVVVINVTSFSKLIQESSLRGAARRITRYQDAMSQIVQQHGGTTDAILGDHIIATFNTAEECDDHEYHATAAAYVMANAPTLDLLGITAHVGVASGTAVVSIVGPAQGPKRHIVVSQAINDAIAFARAGAILCVEIVSPWSHEVLLNGEFVYRFAAELTCLSSAPGKPPKKVAIAEMVAPKNHSQWQSEMRGMRMQIDWYNTAMLCVWKGQLKKAESVPTDNMPEWYQDDVVEAKRRGFVRQLDLGQVW